MCTLRMKCQDTLREVASGFSLNMLLNEKCITSEDEFSFPGHFVCAWWVFPSFSYCNQGEYPLCIPVQICNDRIIVLNNGIDMNFVLFAVDSLLNTKQKLIIIHTFSWRSIENYFNQTNIPIQWYSYSDYIIF